MIAKSWLLIDENPVLSGSGNQGRVERSVGNDVDLRLQRVLQVLPKTGELPERFQPPFGDEEIVIELDKNDSSTILSEYAKELKNSAGE